MSLLSLFFIAIIIIVIIKSNYYYSIITTLAVIVLIGALIVIGYTFKTFKNDKKFPPVLSECPDHWVLEGNNCLNPKSLGRNTDSCSAPKDFNIQPFTGFDGNCKKAEWAKNCEVSWQGITTNSDICNKSLDNLLDNY
jgi:hypothetical protein